MTRVREVDQELWALALQAASFVPLQQSPAYGAALARRLLGSGNDVAPGVSRSGVARVKRRQAVVRERVIHRERSPRKATDIDGKGRRGLAGLRVHRRLLLQTLRRTVKALARLVRGRERAGATLLMRVHNYSRS